MKYLNHNNQNSSLSASASDASAHVWSRSFRIVSCHPFLCFSLLLLTLWVSNRLIHRENCACSLSCSTHNIYSHKFRLPDKLLVHVVNLVVHYVNTIPCSFFTFLCMLLSQLVQNICRVHSRVLSKLFWDNLKSFCECINNKLLLALDSADILS